MEQSDAVEEKGTERSEWIQQNKDKQVDEIWKSWKRVFEEEARKRVGVRKARLEKHHEGIWSERVKELVVLKNKMRKGRQRKAS